MIITGIFFILVGIFLVFVGKGEYHQEYIRKHNFEETEEIMQDIRKIGGVVFIIIGILIMILGILT